MEQAINNARYLLLFWMHVCSHQKKEEKHIHVHLMCFSFISKISYIPSYYIECNSNFYRLLHDHHHQSYDHHHQSTEYPLKKLCYKITLLFIFVFVAYEAKQHDVFYTVHDLLLFHRGTYLFMYLLLTKINNVIVFYTVISKKNISIFAFIYLCIS